MGETYKSITGAIGDLNKKLKEMRDSGKFNIVGVSEIVNCPEFYMPEVRLVSVNPGPDDGEVYLNESGTYGLTGNALKMFQLAGGIEFPPESVKVENMGDDVVSAYVYGERVDTSGVIKTEQDIAVCNLTTREAFIRQSFQQKVTEEEQYRSYTTDQRTRFIEEQTKLATLRMGQSISQIATTIAKGRVIQKLLGLKPYHTLEELKKQFVIVAMLLKIDMTDPVIKSAVSMRILGIRDRMYTSSAGIPQPKTVQVSLLEEEPVFDKATLVGFRSFPRMTREKTVNSFLEKTGVAPDKSVSEMSDAELTMTYNKLAALM